MAAGTKASIRLKAQNTKMDKNTAMRINFQGGETPDPNQDTIQINNIGNNENNLDDLDDLEDLGNQP